MHHSPDDAPGDQEGIAQGGTAGQQETTDARGLAPSPTPTDAMEVDSDPIGRHGLNRPQHQPQRHENPPTVSGQEGDQGEHNSLRQDGPPVMPMPAHLRQQNGELPPGDGDVSNGHSAGLGHARRDEVEGPNAHVAEQDTGPSTEPHPTNPFPGLNRSAAAETRPVPEGSTPSRRRTHTSNSVGGTTETHASERGYPAPDGQGPDPPAHATAGGPAAGGSMSSPSSGGSGGTSPRRRPAPTGAPYPAGTRQRIDPSGPGLDGGQARFALASFGGSLPRERWEAIEACLNRAGGRCEWNQLRQVLTNMGCTSAIAAAIIEQWLHAGILYLLNDPIGAGPGAARRRITLGSDPDTLAANVAWGGGSRDL